MDGKTAIGYTRISQPSDTSISSQKSDIEKYCENNNIELIKIFNEGEMSGFKNDREQYNKAIKYAKEKDVDLIIVRDISRFSRSFAESIVRTIRLRDQHGIKLFDLETKADISDPIQFKILLDKQFYGEWMKKLEIERGKKELEKRKKKNLPMGRPPYGFTYNETKDKLIPDVEKFENALKVIRLRDKDKSYTDIEEETEVNRSTAYKIMEKRELYEENRDKYLKMKSE